MCQLPYFAIGSPASVTVQGLPQIRIRNLVETAPCIKARRNLVGDRLIVDESVCVRGADGLFLKALGLEHSAFHSCDLRTDERRSVFKILWAMLRPNFEVPVVSCQRLEMLLFLVGRCGVPGGRAGKRAIEAKLRRFELRRGCPKHPLCRQ